MDTITIGTDGWCQPSDVRKYLPQYKDRLGDGTGPITDTETAEWITARFYQMNAAVAPLGITLTNLDADTTAEAVLKRINRLGAALDVVRALGLGASGGGVEDLRELGREWEAELKRLRAGYYNLGAVQTTKQSTVRLTTALKSGGDDEDPDIELDTAFG
jgi:hypothetical protein